VVPTIIRCLLLGQATFNRTHQRGFPNTGPGTEPARRIVDHYVATAETLGDPVWVASARRAAFDLELTHAEQRATANRERPWLGEIARQAFDAAETAMIRSRTPMWLAQWEILRMRVGLLLRDAEALVRGGSGFLTLCAEHPWIARDHLSEQYEYETWRRRALRQRLPGADSLPEVSLERRGSRARRPS
jgi:hypothetical protein